MPSRIAVFTDTHANLQALRAVIRAIGADSLDAVFRTGDALPIGPYPAECLDLLCPAAFSASSWAITDSWKVSLCARFKCSSTAEVRADPQPF